MLSEVTNVYMYFLVIDERLSFIKNYKIKTRCIADKRKEMGKARSLIQKKLYMRKSPQYAINKMLLHFILLSLISLKICFVPGSDICIISGDFINFVLQNSIKFSITNL